MDIAKSSLLFLLREPRPRSNYTETWLFEANPHHPSPPFLIILGKRPPPPPLPVFLDHLRKTTPATPHPPIQARNTDATDAKDTSSVGRPIKADANGMSVLCVYIYAEERERE